MPQRADRCSRKGKISQMVLLTEPQKILQDAQLCLLQTFQRLLVIFTVYYDSSPRFFFCFLYSVKPQAEAVCFPDP